MVQDRIVELETRIAYQEHTLETLGDEVARQQKRIEQLEAAVRQLVERSAQTETFRGTAADERPPHY
jgi:SlyX protein